MNELNECIEWIYKYNSVNEAHKSKTDWQTELRQIKKRSLEVIKISSIVGLMIISKCIEFSEYIDNEGPNAEIIIDVLACTQMAPQLLSPPLLIWNTIISRLVQLFTYNNLTIRKNVPSTNAR